MQAFACAAAVAVVGAREYHTPDMVGLQFCMYGSGCVPVV